MQKERFISFPTGRNYDGTTIRGGEIRMIKKVFKESLSITDEKITELKKVIPEVFTEGKIDFEKLQRTLGKEINGKDEKYSFNWAGRKETLEAIANDSKVEPRYTQCAKAALEHGKDAANHQI